MSKHSFAGYVLAGYPMLWVETHEEYRALSTYCSDMKKSKEKYRILSWDEADGIVELDFNDGVLHRSKPIENDEGGPITDPIDMLNWMDKKADDNTVIFLLDFHNPLTKAQAAPMYRRKIRNLLPKFKANGKVLAILSPVVDIPPELDKEITLIPFSLPTRDELRIVLRAVCESAGIDSKSPVFPKNDEDLLNAALGMTAVEAENAYAVSLIEAKKFDPAIIQREKAAIVRKENILEIVDVEETLDDIGGLEYLKEFLLESRKCFSEEAKDFGATAPKGLLLVGVPGTGKSLSAKAAGSAFKRPVLRFDVGNVFSKWVGESEGNMGKVLATAEAIAPCIIWIDELEKAFSGLGSESDGGATKRVFQKFLTWLQERKSDVFVIATANSVESLPPELLRSGRIDGIYWVDLPDAVQREEILKIHLGKKGRKIDVFGDKVSDLVNISENFSGAEIETWVKKAVNRAFSQGHKDVTFEDMVVSANDITPVYQLMKTKITAAQEWAKQRGAKNASIVHEKEDTSVKKGRKLSVG